MKQIVWQIVFLAAIAHSCSAKIIVQTSERETVTRLYEAMIDVLMECYANGSKTIGVVGDSDGIVLKTLWKKYSISAALIDSTIDSTMTGDSPPLSKHHALEVFVIVANVDKFFPLVYELRKSVWFNHNAKFLIMSPTPNEVIPRSHTVNLLFQAYYMGLLNAQCIDFDPEMNPIVIDYNPFTAKAPHQWKPFGTMSENPLNWPFYVFYQVYRKAEQTCKALDFVKTTDLGGYPFHFIVTLNWLFCGLTNKTCTKSDLQGYNITAVDKLLMNEYRWFIDNIQMGLNATVVIRNASFYNRHSVGMMLVPLLESEASLKIPTSDTIYTFDQVPIFVVTQHTGHMTQLEKILSVIDKKSRIGMYLVYLITFLFFKFFLRQAVMPAVLNLVRLTCNTGLPKLPNNLAPTIYLACLFMFMINLQAIYTGNLASLLTQTVAYPHVNTKADIAKLGYTIYSFQVFYTALAAEPILDGRVVKLALNDSVPCVDYVLRDPLVACAGIDHTVIKMATEFNLHVSRYPMRSDYVFHLTTPFDPSGRRVQDIVRRWHETGLRRIQPEFERSQSELVDDDEVKRNVVMRVMSFSDLRFAFVILGIGLSCSLLCFIVELSIPYVSSKYAKRRDRVRPIMASGVPGSDAA